MAENSIAESETSTAYLGNSLEYLGKGVNVFHEGYLVPPHIGGLLRLTENEVTTTNVGQTDVVETFGSNFAEFIQNFSVAAGLNGSYKGFTGSVETKFASSTRDSVETKFAQLSLISTGSILSISQNPDVLKRYLTPDFEKALAEADPVNLLKLCGTHVAITVVIGGMLSYYSYSKKTEHLSDHDFEVAAELKYKQRGAEVGANSKLTHKEIEKANTVEGSMQLSVNGGSQTTRSALEGGKHDSFKAWAATIDDYPGFLGFRPDGLIPIWRLAPTKERAAAIELAFRQMAAREFQIRIFTKTGDLAAHPDAQVGLPKYYKLLGGGARENFSGAGNLLTASFPHTDSTWVARGKDHVLHDDASITAFALGIYDNLDCWEVKHVSATGSPASHPSAEVALPADFIAEGGVLVGGGAVVKDGPGANKLLTSSYPKSETTWAANATDYADDKPSEIEVFVRGLRCKVEGIKVEVKTDRLQSRREAHPSEKCSLGQDFSLTGGGAFVDYGSGPGNLLTSCYPESDRTWAASSKDHQKSSPATITAYAIGLKVS
ncbi:MAC/perforin domain-containing protein [Bradyrhizobium sp. YR681]|uniref:MAC/perforin domain-containing protein n=1 Tax=Bradyrhizobium sp. YR681 TaxID=1144344 RepID=UPI00026FBA20|nr:MAC/perforin domain-containing protein [Bradyrhizobium sp. YR681]EJN08860.1 MAC/perforin domain-containing protein [Bradyrhizobium sp. YR681]